MDRAQRTAELLNEFSENTGPPSRYVLAACPDYFSADGKPITKARCEELFGAEKGSELGKVRAGVITYLNYIESLCVQYEMNILDERAFATQLAPHVVRAQERLGGFIDALADETDTVADQPIARVAAVFTSPT